MLGKRLSELRNKHKLRQEDVANKIGIARTTYAMYEQGKREPDYETLTRLADFFDKSVDYLLGRETQLVQDPKINYGSGSYFYFDKDAITEEDAELLADTYEIMKERAKKRAEKRKKGRQD